MGNRETTAHEFFAPLPLLAVALFAANNFYLKFLAPGFITGKLSDALACFFLPLFISSVLEPFAPRSRRARVAVGCLLTLVLFTAVKTVPVASRALDQTLSLLTAPFPLRLSSNRVDPSDLLALPFVGAAFVYSSRSPRRAREP